MNKTVAFSLGERNAVLAQARGNTVTAFGGPVPPLAHLFDCFRYLLSTTMGVSPLRRSELMTTNKDQMMRPTQANHDGDRATGRGRAVRATSRLFEGETEETLLPFVLRTIRYRLSRINPNYEFTDADMEIARRVTRKLLEPHSKPSPAPKLENESGEEKRGGQD